MQFCMGLAIQERLIEACWDRLGFYFSLSGTDGNVGRTRGPQAVDGNHWGAEFRLGIVPKRLASFLAA